MEPEAGEMAQSRPRHSRTGHQATDRSSSHGASFERFHAAGKLGKFRLIIHATPRSNRRLSSPTRQFVRFICIHRNYFINQLQKNALKKSNKNLKLIL